MRLSTHQSISYYPIARGFFTPLRYVQNDMSPRAPFRMTWACAPFRVT